MRSTTNPAPVLRCSKRPKQQFIYIPSRCRLAARWQHRTARRQQSNQTAMSDYNKLTFDPPTHLPELTLNLIWSSHAHSAPSLKSSCKSVQPFSRNLADKETKKQRNRSKKYPSAYRGRGNDNVRVFTLKAIRTVT